MDITTKKRVSQWEWGAANHLQLQGKRAAMTGVCVCVCVAACRVSATLNMALTSKDGTNQRYIFPGTQDMNWCQISVETSAVSVLEPANPGHFQIPSQHRRSVCNDPEEWWLSLSLSRSEETRMNTGQEVILTSSVTLFAVNLNVATNKVCAIITLTFSTSTAHMIVVAR